MMVSGGDVGFDGRRKMESRFQSRAHRPSSKLSRATAGPPGTAQVFNFQPQGGLIRTFQGLNCEDFYSSFLETS